MAIANILGIVVLIVAAGMELYSMILSKNVWRNVTGILILCALLSACMYFVYGAKKDVAGYYKGFLIIFAVSEFIRIILTQLPREVSNEIVNELPNKAASGTNELLIPMMSDVIIFTIVCILLFATDLGKKKSMIFGYIVIAVSLIEMIISIAPVLNVADLLPMMIADFGTRFVLSLSLILMLVGKYKDKAERHTK